MEGDNVKSKVKVFSFVAGVTLVLGFPLVSVLKPGLSPEKASIQSNNSQVALASSHSGLGGLYDQWQVRYEKNGGDRKAVIGIGWVRGLSTEFSKANGRVDLDMIGGAISAEVEGLGDVPADLWLVDNSDAPGTSITPSEGDHMVRIGRFEPDGKRVRVESSLGRNFFHGFELDLAVVTRAGKTPVDGGILFGSRSVLERLYTKARIEAERRQPASPFASLLSAFEPRPAHANQILVSHGLVSQLVDDGAELFFRGTFSGNGRTCGTCHPQENNQTIDEAFIATLPASDPLFIAEKPVSQGGVPGLERPVLMRNFGLILENVDGAENPTVKFAMRGVPHSLSMATSILAPADGRAAQQRVGWSGDGAPAPVTLRLFSVGAVNQHFTKTLNRVQGVDFVLPSNAQLDAMEAFMLSCGRTNELSLASVSLLSVRAEAGRQIFLNDNLGKCNRCHGNAGANVPATPATNNNFNTGVERFPNPARAVESFPFDGGFGTANFDCNGDGINDCFGDGTFNTVGLVEAADTAPFFHGNSHETIEDSVAFFTTPEFANSPSGQFLGPIVLSSQQISDVGDFLRVVNAAFNVALAVQRNEAGIAMENSSKLPLPSENTCGPGGIESACSGEENITGKKETIDKLLMLSNAEIQDAIDVLQAKGLHADAVTLLNTAISKNNAAILEGGSNQRKQLMTDAKTNLTNAKAKFGTGLNFTLGQGNLTF
jgi:cytochrome c peroxidase